MVLSMLAGLGIDFVKDMIADKGEDLVAQGIKKVTGIDVSKKTTLSTDEIITIKQSQKALSKELELIYADKQNARNMSIQLSKSKSWLVANTGSLIAIFTVLSAFILDIIILYMVFNNQKVSPILTLIAGANNVKAGQVLSFYFGSSKEQADSKR
jgi:nitrogen fixation/metabolism regulation signal transduction histidine kinase